MINAHKALNTFIKVVHRVMNWFNTSVWASPWCPSDMLCWGGNN